MTLDIQQEKDKIKKWLTKKDTSDVIFSLSKLFVNITKSIGILPKEYQVGSDVLGFIEENFFTTASQRRQIDFLLILFERLNNLEEIVQKEIIDKEEFEIYLQRITDNIKHESYKDKILAFRNALVNIATGNIQNDFEIEYFIKYLINFSDLHFALLLYYHKPEEALIKAGIDIQALKRQSGGSERIIQDVFKNVNFELIKVAGKELMDVGFTIKDLPVMRAMGTGSTYEILTQNYLTELGAGFINFCLDQCKEEDITNKRLIK
ncbi:MAG: hypothetical protein KJ771_02230 [Nanoarchaeota archaeon]|nr:hypothetical protein [Nanoarchaeota archaeon]